MADIRVCFSYAHIEAPLDGSNNFSRALRQYVSRVPGYAITDDLHGDYDILFMNQLSRSPGAPYALSEIRAALGGHKKKKLVVRAINLERNRSESESVSFLSRHFTRDRTTLELLRMADFVIFQSMFQKSLFERFGYHGENNTIIHNGAAPVFLDIPAGARKLGEGDDLFLVSSAMAATKIKRHNLIASMSLIPGVQIIHYGIWPEGTDKGNVRLAGVCSHAEMARLYERGHYFLHPAVQDVCPNSLIEGLCAGLPAIYNPGPGSGQELGGEFGIPLDENDLPGTSRRARENYDQMATALADHRRYFSIDRAAPDYVDVFETTLRR